MTLLEQIKVNPCWISPEVQAAAQRLQKLSLAKTQNQITKDAFEVASAYLVLMQVLNEPGTPQYPQ